MHSCDSATAWSRDRVRHHYDLMAGLYRRYWGDHIHHGLFLHDRDTPGRAQLRMLEHCAGLISPPRRGNVLDVGCGHGGTALFLARRFDCRVLGLTISPRQAATARRVAAIERLSDRIAVELADAENFPYPAGVFDIVWTMESSEHFEDKQSYFHNVFRALKPGGRLLLAAWTGSMQNAGVRQVAEIFLCPTLQTSDVYRQQIEQSGLRVIALEDLSASVQRTWAECGARIRPFAFLLEIMPTQVREFARGIEVILAAYKKGSLTYTVLAAEKQYSSSPVPEYACATVFPLFANCGLRPTTNAPRPTCDEPTSNA